MAILIGIIFGIVALIAWGISDFFAAHSTRNTNATKTFFWSQATSLALLTITFFLFFFKIPSISTVQWIQIVALTVVTIAAFLTFYKGLHVGKVGSVSPIVAAWPTVTLFFALTLLGEHLTSLQGIAVALVILGGVLSSFKIHNILKMNFKSIVKGANYAVAAAVLFGIAFTIVDPLVATMGFFIPMLVSKAMQVPILAAYARTRKIDISFPRNIVLPIALVGGLEFVGLMSYTLAISSEFTAVIAPMASAVPMVTIILARIFFKERLDAIQWLGVFTVLTGVAILSI